MPGAVRRNLPWLCGVAIVGLSLALALAVWSPIRVNGGSMEPALQPGDIALVRKDAEVRVGDIALVSEAGHSSFLHRVVGRAADGRLELKGDANAIADRADVPESAVEGPVVGVIRFGEWAEQWRQLASVR